MSRGILPKQLIPFIQGKSLLEIAFQRLEGLIPASRRYVCAGVKHREAIIAALPALEKEHFLGEPAIRLTPSGLAPPFWQPKIPKQCLQCLRPII